MAATTTQVYFLTDNSYYSFSQADNDGNITTSTSTLSGVLVVIIDDVNFTADISYDSVSLNCGSFRENETLTTDSAGLNSPALISGNTGEPDYMNFGNAILAPFPFICVECGYEMRLNLTANPLVLSYHETNPFDTGAVDFELYVSPVPLPSAMWLFGSALLGLLGFAKRRK